MIADPRARRRRRRGAPRIPGARLAGLVGVLLAAATLSGCLALPTSGDVAAASLRSGDDGNQQINFVVHGPSDGETQEQILDGYIQAGLAPQNSYATARTYLSDDLRSKWNPAASVDVWGGVAPSVVRTGENSLRLTLQIEATVDANGAYRIAPAGDQVSLDVEFSRVGGQWRISNVPDGTIVSSANFATVFRPYPIYFFAPGWGTLVPDLRWLPSSQGTAERIVQSLLHGPSEDWLGQGALVSGFPAGSETASVASVPINDGVATVDLPSSVLSQQDTAAKQHMLEQLTASLEGLSSVRQVQITVSGAAIQVPDAQNQPAQDPQVNSAVVGARGQSIGVLSSASGSAGTSGPSAIQGVMALNPVALTLSADHSAAVLRTAAGKVFRLGSNGAAGAVPLTTQPATAPAPSIDAAGNVWTCDSTGRVTVWDIKGVAHPLSTAGELPAGTVVSFRLSRDETRVALGINLNGGGSELVMLSVRPDTSAVGLPPAGLGAPSVVDVEPTLQIVDLAWVDELNVAVLATNATSTSTVFTAEVGGLPSSLGTVVSSTSIVGGNNGTEGIRVLTAGQAVLALDGAGNWQTEFAQVTLLATQQ